MLLAVDSGNTQTVVGLYDLDRGRPAAGRRPEDGLLDHWRVATQSDRTSDEMAVLLQGFLSFRGYSLDDVDGIAVSSGVPRVTASLRDLATRYLDFEPIVIEPGVRTGISILYENPKEVGADRIANAVAAFDLYGGPTIVADFGTATTCDAVSENGEYLGGAIAPGIEISMDALVGRGRGPSSCRTGRAEECARQEHGRVHPVRCGVRLCGTGRWSVRSHRGRVGRVHGGLDRWAGRSDHALLTAHTTRRALAHVARPATGAREELVSDG